MTSPTTPGQTAAGKRPARSRLRKQFGRPTGWLGALAGQLMARKNRAMNLAAVELLDVKPTDRILEIGFGPGVAIEALSRSATVGLVAGIDPSAVMLRQATKRNRQAIEAGRVVLKSGTASELPFDDGAFDKVLAVSDGEGDLKLGAPTVDGASVTAEVLGPQQGEKIVVQKFRRRKNSRSKTGHRSMYTRVKIDKISG